MMRDKRRAPCLETPLSVLAMRLVRGVSVRHEDLDARYVEGWPEVGIRQFGRFLNGRSSTNGVGERRHGTMAFPATVTARRPKGIHESMHPLGSKSGFVGKTRAKRINTAKRISF